METVLNLHQEGRRKAREARWRVINKLLFWLQRKGARGVAFRYGVSDRTVREKVRSLGVEWSPPAKTSPPVKTSPVKTPQLNKLDWTQLLAVHSLHPVAPRQETRCRLRKVRWLAINRKQLLFWLQQKGIPGVASRYDVTRDTVRRKVRKFGIQPNLWK